MAAAKSLEANTFEQIFGTNGAVQCFGEELLTQLLQWNDVFPVIENVLARYSITKSMTDIVQPVRTTFTAPLHGSRFYAMPCYIGQEDIFCTKLLVANPQNAALGIATHTAIILLFDGKTGELKALFSAERITAMRTAATSAIATKHLVHGSPNVLAILGSGVQARSHVDAHRHLYPNIQVRVWNIRESSGKRFVEEMLAMGVETAVFCNTVRNAVEDADIICVVCTSDGSPILQADWVKPGAHINAIGANQPELQELDPVLVQNSIVYVDCRNTALKESGDIIMSKAEIFAEIGEVIAKTKEAKSSKTTIFKSSGIAIEDAAIANLALTRQSN